MELCRFTVLIIVLICIGFGYKEDKFVNPYYLFVLTPVTLLMYVDLGGRYFVTIDVNTWNLAIINMLAFICGLKFTSDFKTKSIQYGIISEKKAYKHILVLYALSWVAPFSGPLRNVLPLLSTVVVVLAFSTRNKKIILLYTFLVVFKMVVGHSSKTGVLSTLFAYLISYEYYYITTTKQRIKVLILSLCSVFFMIFAFSFANKNRGNYDAKSGLEYYSRDGLDWNLDSRLFLPYMYLETPWINLQYVTRTQDTRTYGLWALKPILGYAGLRDDSVYDLIPYSSFNTFTFISCHFKDFGYYGSILLSFFLGFFVKKIYSLSNKSPSPFMLGSYVLVAQATLEMFFSNHFFMQSYPFTICIMMWLYQRVFTKAKKND
ncbi:MAG: O-antigen polymerase [Paludibacteraceae bacterium]|nr:O-antigen polymerase [Paludibacteraceae bacterium]